MIVRAAASFLAECESLLRSTPARLTSMPVWRLALIAGLFGALYGAMMGTFEVDGAPRALQMGFSAVKVPLLFLVTFLLSLPTYFVLMTLLGLRDDLHEALRSLLATQACAAIVLASMSPFTVLWYLSSRHYNQAVLFNGVVFALASLAGQKFLARFYRPLIGKDARHRSMLRAWLVIYAFVGIQMGWVLRPFVGDPERPTAFFREEAWGNAYEAVFEHVRAALKGG